MINRNDAEQLILTRRSTRKFRDLPVPEDRLTEIIEAGRHAPSGGNSQTTHLLVIRDKKVLADIAALAEKLFAAMEVTPGMYRSMAGSVRSAKKGGYIFHYSAPVLILTANDKDYSNNIADCSCVLENMMIMANACDLGSCWINQIKWLRDEPEMIAFLEGLGLKENERVYGGLALGFADSEDGLPVRTPLPRTGNPVTYIG